MRVTVSAWLVGFTQGLWERMKKKNVRIREEQLCWTKGGEIRMQSQVGGALSQKFKKNFCCHGILPHTPFDCQSFVQPMYRMDSQWCASLYQCHFVLGAATAGWSEKALGGTWHYVCWLQVQYQVDPEPELGLVFVKWPALRPTMLTAQWLWRKSPQSLS